MIAAKRATAVEPESLFKEFRDGTTELDRATKHFIDDNNAESFEFDRYRSADVKRALDEIFHGKCAYCESYYAKTQPVDVEHFRPKGKVDDAPGHRGYWWLAMDWKNLLPSCIDCNRKRGQRTPKPDQHDTMVELNANGDFIRGKTFNTGKQSAFPLEADSPRSVWDPTQKSINLNAEKRLLLDPTLDEPDDHLVFHIDRSDPEKLISIVYPKPLGPVATHGLPVLGTPAEIAGDANAKNVSASGAVSIQVYGLNRLSLVQARTKMLRDLEFLLEMSISLKELSGELETRIQDRQNKINASTGPDKAELERDQLLDERISSRLNELAEKAISKMTEMTEPTAQFSALAKSWMNSFVNA